MEMVYYLSILNTSSNNLPHQNEMTLTCFGVRHLMVSMQNVYFPNTSILAVPAYIEDCNVGVGIIVSL